MANTCWWYYFSKFTEFADTLFFVLRKKNEHVSTLHVIHHGIMPMSVWFGMKFAPGSYKSILIIALHWRTLCNVILIVLSKVRSDSCQYLHRTLTRKYLPNSQNTLHHVNWHYKLHFGSTLLGNGTEHRMTNIFVAIYALVNIFGRPVACTQDGTIRPLTMNIVYSRILRWICISSRNNKNWNRL